ncbi:MAG: glycerol-3-phosphate 1-O-acyltransferase PlsY [Clostridiales bacterium]|nr:glycerol-3-phosphate 1-O-acyltransferase PlsY [Clostridiales bacterium]
MIFLKYAFCAIIGYLLGTFTAGVFVAKVFSNLDIRKVGSGNPGTTNVLRTLGWLPSILTLLGDMIKGLLGAWIGYLLAGDIGARIGGVCAVAGHNWPVFAGFKGGKGIAASWGAILAIEPWFGLAILVVEIGTIAVTRCVSIASIAAAVSYSILTIIFRWGNWTYIAFALVLTAFAVYSHRANIDRLIKGTENKLDFKKINSISKNRKK